MTQKRIHNGIVRAQALVRGRIARKVYRAMQRKEAFRRRSAKEIFDTENSFVKQMHLLVTVRHSPSCLETYTYIY